jgi:PH domain
MTWPSALASAAVAESMVRGDNRDGGSPQPTGINSASTNERPAQTQTTYGYHNTFHTHATPSITEASPPNYDVATSQLPHCLPSHSSSSETDDLLPRYSCTIHCEGELAVRCELATPFLESVDRKWHEIYAVLRGTQLSIYRLKTGGFLSPRKKLHEIGRLVKTYSLQHAEVGIAVDHKREELVPRSAFAKLVPTAARHRLWETDPGLFEPIREWVIRLRLETEQVLMCAATQEEMLDWVEKLCVAIDISPPLEDRSEPRYRSLPRRNRRQRQIEGLLTHLDSLREDAVGRRLIEQQERLIRRLYPRLAAQGGAQEPGDDEQEREAEHRAHGQDPEAEDLDPADVTEGTTHASSRPATSAIPASLPERSSSVTPEAPVPIPLHGHGTGEEEGYNPKTTIRPNNQSRSAQLRYRRRCAPILLASSPRSSEVIFSNGKRTRMDINRHRLVPFDMAPPRYDVGHTSPLTALASVLEEVTEDDATGNSSSNRRPTLSRGVSEQSYASGSSGWAGEAEAEHAEASSLHTSSTASSHAVNLDGSSADEPQRGSSLDRVDSAFEENETLISSVPPSPTSPAANGMSKSKAILVVSRMKEGQLAHLEDASVIDAAARPSISV